MPGNRIVTIFLCQLRDFPTSLIIVVACFEGTLGHKTVKTVLFLCTGNYYRSRFAEELFNHRAAEVGINWQARSCALAIERGLNNIGPLSPFVLWGLTTRGLSARRVNRSPQQCSTLDLESADYIVALDEVEHRPIMSERFPQWATRIRYWEIGDVPLLQPNDALALIDVRVDGLVASFREPHAAA
jgi:protein-tyrosine phosphatase